MVRTGSPLMARDMRNGDPIKGEKDYHGESGNNSIGIV